LWVRVRWDPELFDQGGSGSVKIVPDPYLTFFAVLRIRDVYSGSRILIFTHPGSRIQKQQQKRGVKKISWHTFFYSHKFNNIVNYFISEMLNKKIWANFQKIVTKLSKIWVWDPGSEIRDPEKPSPDPGSRGQKGTGSRIRIRNTAVWQDKFVQFLQIFPQNGLSRL
jgi:hypothetical protein